MERTKRKNKAQLALFVIIAFLIIAVVGLVIYFTYESYKRTKVQTQQYLNNMKSFMDTCFEYSTKVVLFKISFGGYYQTPELSTEVGIPYYFIEEKNLTPSLAKIEDEIKKGIYNEFLFCVNNFSAFNTSTLTVSPHEPIINAEIKEKTIEISINYAIEISSKMKETSLLNYSNKKILNLRLYDIYSLANAIVKEYIKKDSVSLMPTLPKVEGIDVRYFTSDGDIIFRIVDKESLVYEKNFDFWFAGKTFM
jgi:hypothetical protein